MLLRGGHVPIHDKLLAGGVNSPNCGIGFASSRTCGAGHRPGPLFQLAEGYRAWLAAEQNRRCNSTRGLEMRPRSIA